MRHKDALAEVTSVRPFVVLRNLATGESRRFKPKDVRSASRVDAERFEAKIERLDSGQVVAIHPESGAARPVQPAPVRGTSQAVVVWTREAAVLSGLPAVHKSNPHAYCGLPFDSVRPGVSRGLTGDRLKFFTCFDSHRLCG